MKLFKVELKHLYTYESHSDEDKAKYARAIEVRRALLEKLGLNPGRDDIGWVRDMLVNDQQFIELATGGQEPVIQQEIPVPEELEPGDVTGTMAKFNRIAKKLLSLPGLTEPRSYNSRCEVHMPGQALATYNEVLLLESACSDELQTSLDQGWRMIAACPQPDQRRPDYILGRFNPNREGLALGGGAKRQP